MPRPSRRHLESAERVREIRRLLSLTQAEFAERLGVSRRTVIRGEQRGLEVPWAEWKSRGAVRVAWDKLARAADRRTRRDTSTIVKVSRKRKRLRLSRDLLRDRRRRPSRVQKEKSK